MPGNPRSSTMAANSSVSPRSQAVSPSRAVSTRNPAAVRTWATSAEMRGSSSTTSTRIGLFFLGFQDTAGGGIDIDVDQTAPRDRRRGRRRSSLTFRASPRRRRFRLCGGRARSPQPRSAVWPRRVPLLRAARRAFRAHRPRARAPRGHLPRVGRRRRTAPVPPPRRLQRGIEQQISKPTGHSHRSRAQCPSTAKPMTTNMTGR